MKHQQPDWEYKYGHSEILPNQLYLGGEDDVDELLYGKEEAFNLNGKGQFHKNPEPMVDMWIDLRDLRDNNRQVFVPSTVEHVSIPFQDGVLEQAREHLPTAMKVLKEALNSNKRVLVSCHQGKSRSSLLLLWFLCQKMESFQESYWHLKSKRPIMEIDRKFTPFLEELKLEYPTVLQKW